MNYTNIEQSKKLLELGLNPKSADMYFMNICPEDGKTLFDDVAGVGNADISNNDLPCWSLNALLEVMPQSIRMYDERGRCYKTYDLNLFRSYYHCCSYSFGPSLKEENHDNLYCYGGDTWLEAVYNMIIFLFNNGYMKAEKS